MESSISQCPYLMEGKSAMPGPPVHLVIEAHFNDNALWQSGVSPAEVQCFKHVLRAATKST